jgi:uncharacterized protein YaeQ
MALPSTRFEFRVRLAHVDRGIELEEPVIVARHPSETQVHVIQRVLARCLLRTDELEFGPGLSTPDAADLWARDATGELRLWVECGGVTAERLRKILQHHHRLETHVLMDDATRLHALREELLELGLPRGAKVTFWAIDSTLVKELAAREDRRQKWQVTIVGDCFYVDVEGKSFSGAVTMTTVGG